MVVRDAEAYLKSGNTKVGIGDYKGAILEYTKAIEIDPYSASAYLSRAIAKEAIGDISGYNTDFEMAYRLNPNGMKNLF